MSLADRLRGLSRNQKILIGAGVAVVVILVAALLVAGGGNDDVAATTTTTTEATTTTTLPPVAPLTGVPEPDEAKRTRPALIVKVDNGPKALPLHEGLDSADIVYVEEVENGATRIAAVFQSKDDTVGPVRSARTSDLEIAGNLNMPYFAYSGANGGVLRLVREGPMIDMGVDRSEAARVYSRNQRGSQSLYRFFFPTNEMYEVGREGAGTPPQLFAYRDAGAEAPGTETATGVQIAYPGGAATTVKYEWDGNGWARSQNGNAHVMADTQARITPPNVVVQFAPYSASDFIDVTGARSPEAELVGEGSAWIFTGGKVARGKWSRPARDQVTSFTDAAGTPIGLTPGQTFVELVPAPGSFLGQGTVTIL